MAVEADVARRLEQAAQGDPAFEPVDDGGGGPGALHEKLPAVRGEDGVDDRRDADVCSLRLDALGTGDVTLPQSRRAHTRERRRVREETQGARPVGRPAVVRSPHSLADELLLLQLEMPPFLAASQIDELLVRKVRSMKRVPQGAGARAESDRRPGAPDVSLCQEDQALDLLDLGDGSPVEVRELEEVMVREEVEVVDHGKGGAEQEEVVDNVPDEDAHREPSTIPPVASR